MFPPHLSPPSFCPLHTAKHHAQFALEVWGKSLSVKRGASISYNTSGTDHCTAWLEKGSKITVSVSIAGGHADMRIECLGRVHRCAARIPPQGLRFGCFLYRSGHECSIRRLPWCDAY